MKLATFEVKTVVGPIVRLGAVIKKSGTEQKQDQLVDLTSGYTAYLADAGEETRIYENASFRIPPNMIEFLEGGDLSMNAAQNTLNFIKKRLNDTESTTGPKGEKLIFTVGDPHVKLLAPVPVPRMVFDYSEFEDHGSTRGHEKNENWYKRPRLYYKGDVTSFIGTDEPFPKPYYTKQLDLEFELGIIIGKKGRNIPVEEAGKYIAGYSIFIDGSCRDVSTGPNGIEQSMQKHKDFCNSLGPYLVTPDEFNERDAKATMRVNGEVWFEDNIGHNRVFYAPELVAYTSDNKTIMPGELLGSGTINHGSSIDIGKWFEPGMVVEMEIEGIGVMTHRIVQDKMVVDYALNGMENYAHLKYEDRPAPGKTRSPPVKG